MTTTTRSLIRDLVSPTGLHPGDVRPRPARDLLGSPFRVTTAATTAVGAALDAVAALDSIRTAWNDGPSIWTPPT